MRQKRLRTTGLDQWRSNPPATLSIARSGTLQGAAKSSRLLSAEIIEQK